ncbi:hypothetical protein [Achromobacter sp.]|uniref:hypothetical protein n=1 Tax=Achromobacter sp. TaxID=134375 RepID=UPI003C71E46F
MSMRQLKPHKGEGGGLAHALLSYRRAFVNAGIFSGVIAIAMLAPTIYMLQIYDRVLVSSNEDTMKTCCMTTNGRMRKARVAGLRFWKLGRS